MKKTLTFLFLLAFLPLSGQVKPSDILEKIESGRVSMAFSFSGPEKVPVNGDGTVLLQGGMYLVRTNGMEIISDGKTRWTVDRKAKEVYIENEDRSEIPFANPSDLLKAVSLSKSGPDSLSGAWTNPEDGNRFTFRLSGIKSGKASKETSEFSFGTDKLDKDWIVTDLR